MNADGTLGGTAASRESSREPPTVRPHLQERRFSSARTMRSQESACLSPENGRGHLSRSRTWKNSGRIRGQTDLSPISVFANKWGHFPLSRISPRRCTYLLVRYPSGRLSAGRKFVALGFGDAVLANLIEQGLVTDLQKNAACLRFQLVSSQCFRDGFGLGLIFRAARQRLQPARRTRVAAPRNPRSCRR